MRGKIRETKSLSFKPDFASSQETYTYFRSKVRDFVHVQHKKPAGSFRASHELVPEL